MQQRSPAKKITRHIYTWNPDLGMFLKLPLQEKIMMFNQTVLWCQAHFQDQTKKDEQSVCLIIAPDLIFSGEGGSVCSHEDNEDLKVRLSLLQMQIDARVLVIAGTIRYFTKSMETYKITAYVISQNAIQSYSKKESASHVIHDGRSIPLAKGEQSGIFKFDNLDIGLEICQDHNTGTLIQELGNRGVDVHVLLCNAQNIRAHHIAADARRNGTFIVCELRPRHVVNDSKIFERTACYSLRTSSISTNNLRQAYFERLSKSIATELIAAEQTQLGDVSLSVCNAPSESFTKSATGPQ